MSRLIHGYDTAKLPKWARDEIERLHKKLEDSVGYWRSKALAAAGEGPGAPITVRTHDDLDGELGLSDETIRFYPDPSDRERYLEVDRTSFGIEVSSARFLGVRPTSTNRVQILFEDDTPRDKS